MSREFKFRAWDGQLMHSVDELHFPQGGVKWYGPGVGQGWAKEHPVMQFTGLKDRNGVEIYESDVVQWGHNIDTIGPGLGVIFDGGFEEGVGEVAIGPMGVFFGDKPLYDMMHHMEDPCQENLPELEVIGNIYQHPHLLERP